jgi:hypothetical protein
MKKYNEEYFSVLNKNTGKKLLDCGDEIDALTMVAFDPENRTYTHNKFLMGPVVDVEIPRYCQLLIFQYQSMKEFNRSILTLCTQILPKMEVHLFSQKVKENL